MTKIEIIFHITEHKPQNPISQIGTFKEYLRDQKKLNEGSINIQVENFAHNKSKRTEIIKAWTEIEATPKAEDMKGKLMEYITLQLCNHFLQFIPIERVKFLSAPDFIDGFDCLFVGFVVGHIKKDCLDVIIEAPVVPPCKCSQPFKKLGVKPE